MIKWDVTFEGFDGETVSETLYFHLTKSEIIDLEMTTPGGYAAKLERVGKSASGSEIVQTFKEIVSAAYGHRSGNAGFDKSPEISKKFLNSLAFDALLGEILTDPGAAIKFINGVLPKDIAASPEVKNAISGLNSERSVEDVKIPDPNNLDKSGVWPRTLLPIAPLSDDLTEEYKARVRKITGLENPWDVWNIALPWAVREPTQKELVMMDRGQLMECMGRKNNFWTPPEI